MNPLEITKHLSTIVAHLRDSGDRVPTQVTEAVESIIQAVDSAAKHAAAAEAVLAGLQREAKEQKKAIDDLEDELKDAQNDVEEAEAEKERIDDKRYFEVQGIIRELAEVTAKPHIPECKGGQPWDCPTCAVAVVVQQHAE